MLLPTFTEPSFTAGGSGRQMAWYHMGLGNSDYIQGSREVFSAAFLQLCVCPSSEAVWGPAPSVCLQLELDELQLFLFSFSPQLSPFPCASPAIGCVRKAWTHLCLYLQSPPSRAWWGHSQGVLILSSRFLTKMRKGIMTTLVTL